MTRKMFVAIAAMYAALASGAASAADPVAGNTYFKQRCLMCHVVVPGAKGIAAPNLNGVVGRPAAATEFGYSVALKKSGLKWNAATLDRFLTAPNLLVPGTRMIVNIADPATRGDVIAYLATLAR